VVLRHAKVEIARSKYRAEKVEVGGAAMRRLCYLRIIISSGSLATFGLADIGALKQSFVSETQDILSQFAYQNTAPTE
jgi:hypothetical protein